MLGGTFAACASTFYNNKRGALGRWAGEAKPVVMAAEPMVMAAAQRFLEFYCPRFAFSSIFKSKEDFRTCLLQTGAKVSLDWKTGVA